MKKIYNMAMSFLVLIFFFWALIASFQVNYFKKQNHWLKKQLSAKGIHFS